MMHAEATALPMDPAPAKAGADVRARIGALADQCVKCGVCVPVCPTYRVGRHEAESPRGRIALAQALASGQLAATPALTAHLDQCLACMSCERVCPSQVRYGQLIVAARSLLLPARRLAVLERVVRAALARPRLLRLGLRLANLPGVRGCIGIAGKALRGFGLDRLARELPRLPPAPAPVRAQKSNAASRGRVGLFLGCVAASVDRDVHAAAIGLLQALGYEVVLPGFQGCCGALILHAGDTAGADALAAPTRQSFLDCGVDTVLVSASGCFGTLRDRLFAGTSIRVRDIHEFLAHDERIGELKFRPLASRIALHTPCTQANVVQAGDVIERLLARIPQLEIAALPGEPRCCGAAGDYFLHHGDIADSLRAEKLDQAAALAAQMLVTSNVGCRVFLDNGLRQRGIDVPVTHPVALLARQLDN